MIIHSVIKQRYRIIEQIGHGGMSEVYRCEDLLLKTSRAVKYIEKRDDTVYAYQALKKETELLAELHHPYIPSVIDCFDDIDGYYVIMDFIQGITLHQYLMNHEVKEDQIFMWAYEILDILQYLHSSIKPAIIYRDLKPENIIWDEKRNLFFVDFGIALKTTKGKALNIPCLGTRGYASKEQSHPGWIDCRSDIYSFGATLFFIYTKSLYQGQQIPNVKLKGIIKKCLQENPDDRYQKVEEILNDLRHRKRFYLIPIVLAISSLCFFFLYWFSSLQLEKFIDQQYQMYIKQQNYEQAIQWNPSCKEAYHYLYDCYKEVYDEPKQSIPYALQKMENLSLSALSIDDQDELHMEFAFDCMRLKQASYYRQAAIYFRQVQRIDTASYIRLCDLLSTSTAFDYLNINTIGDLLTDIEKEADQSSYISYRLSIYQMLLEFYNFYAASLGAQVYDTALHICEKAMDISKSQPMSESVYGIFFEQKILFLYHQGIYYETQQQKTKAALIFQELLQVFQDFEYWNSDVPSFLLEKKQYALQYTQAS